MAKPNVWRADIHLTDRIIVRLTFSRLITGTQDFFSLSLSDFVPLWLCCSLYFSTQGDFAGVREGRMPMLIAHIPAQLTCPRFPLLAQILTYPPSSSRWFSKEKYCLLPAHHHTHLPYFSFPATPLSTICFRGPI